MRAIVVKDYWLYWLKVLKKFEGKPISIYELFRKTIGGYDSRLKMHFYKVFGTLVKKKLVIGKIEYREVGRRRIPFVNVEKVCNFKILDKKNENVKILAYFDEETLLSYIRPFCD